MNRRGSVWKNWLGVVGLAAWAIGCGGSGGPSSACRSSGACAGGLVCLDADPGNACGVPPREDCASSADCPMGAVCHAIADACSSDDVGSECRPPCVDDAECGESFHCAADGGCVALTCSEGYGCLAVEQCDDMDLSSSTPVHGRDHRCRKISCSDESACVGAGVCVNDICQSSAGACGELVAVP